MSSLLFGDYNSSKRAASMRWVTFWKPSSPKSHGSVRKCLLSEIAGSEMSGRISLSEIWVTFRVGLAGDRVSWII